MYPRNKREEKTHDSIVSKPSPSRCLVEFQVASTQIKITIDIKSIQELLTTSYDYILAIRPIWGRHYHDYEWLSCYCDSTSFLLEKTPHSHFWPSHSSNSETRSQPPLCDSIGKGTWRADTLILSVETSRNFKLSRFIGNSLSVVCSHS